jgi:hypothetical protein
MGNGYQGVKEGSGCGPRQHSTIREIRASAQVAGIGLVVVALSEQMSVAFIHLPYEAIVSLTTP